MASPWEYLAARERAQIELEQLRAARGLLGQQTAARGRLLSMNEGNTMAPNQTAMLGSEIFGMNPATAGNMYGTESYANQIRRGQPFARQNYGAEQLAVAQQADPEAAYAAKMRQVMPPPLTKDDFVTGQFGALNLRTNQIESGTQPTPAIPDWKQPGYVKFLGDKAAAERAPVAPLTPVEQYQKQFGPLEPGMSPEVRDGILTGRQVPQTGASKDPAVIKANEEAAKTKARPDAEAVLDDLVGGLERIGKEASALKVHPGLGGAVGSVQGRMPSLSKDAANFDTKLRSLRSMLSVSELQAMKQRGLSTGTITESEWPRFESLVTSLESIQDEGQMLNALSEVEAFVEKATGGLVGGFEKKYGPRRRTETPGGGTSAVAPVARGGFIVRRLP